LENSDVHFLHTFRPKNKPGSGWIAKENFQEAYVEDCIVTNLTPLAEGDADDVDDSELVNALFGLQPKAMDWGLFLSWLLNILVKKSRMAIKSCESCS